MLMISLAFWIVGLAAVSHGNPDNSEQPHSNAQRYNNEQPMVTASKGNATQNASHSFDLSALHIAAKNNDLAGIKLLIQQGADINARSKNGSTALHLAAAIGNLPIVRFILNIRNADLTARNNKMETPLMLAERGGNAEVAELLMAMIGDINAESLIHAAKEGKLDVLKSLVTRGGNVDGKNNDGETPLGWAAVNGHKGIVEYLVEEKSAQLENTDKFRNTPLMLAAYFGQLQIVKYLAEKGAQVETKNNDSYSPLMIAVTQGHLQIVKYLVEERSAQMETKDNFGNTPLSMAAYNGDLQIVKYLTERGAHVETKNNYGNTPLLEAGSNGKLEVVKYLVRYKNPHIEMVPGHFPSGFPSRTTWQGSFPSATIRQQTNLPGYGFSSNYHHSSSSSSIGYSRNDYQITRHQSYNF